MTRAARSRIPLETFADILSRFIPGTISEADYYASMVLDYIEDNGMESQPFHVQVLLSNVDFASIAQHQLKSYLLPRIQKQSPTLAMSLNDFAAISCRLAMRCNYTGEILTGNPGSFTSLNCGCTMSYSAVKKLCNKKQTRRMITHDQFSTMFTCVESIHTIYLCNTDVYNSRWMELLPLNIIYEHSRRLNVDDGEWNTVTHHGRHCIKPWRVKIEEDPLGKRAIVKSCLERKEEKKDRLMKYVASNEFQDQNQHDQDSSTQTRKRPRSNEFHSFFPKAQKCIKLLDQTVGLGGDTFTFIEIENEMNVTSFASIFEKFVKVKEAPLIKNAVHLKSKIRFLLQDIHEETVPSSGDTIFRASDWDFDAFCICARWVQG